MANLTTNDLQKGDVLLFEGMKDDFISAAIMFLTDSNVSHSAMTYHEKDGAQDATLVHEASPKVPVSVKEATKTFGDRPITVRRLTRPVEQQKLIAAADRYLLEKAPYNNNGLYLVGIILIYKKMSPFFIKNKKISFLMEKLLRLSAKLVTHYINSKKFPKNHPMTCSQFVAQCYDDAGYPLISYDLMSNAAKDTLLDQVAVKLQEEPRLLQDRALFANQPDLSEAEIVAEANQISKELTEELQNQLASNSLESSSMQDLHGAEADDGLVTAAAEFAMRHYELSNSDSDLMSNSLAGPIEWLKEQRNLFVSPADLLNSDKLETTGIIQLRP